MKTSGYLMLIAGFLTAAFATALDTVNTAWLLFLPAAGVAAAGVAIVNRQARRNARSEGVLVANRDELNQSLGNIVGVLEELTSAQGALDLREQIDTRLRDDLRRFADARESIVHLFGMQAYADIMSDFAAGERYLNRVWSATADGYAAEASSYLARAMAQFRDAQSRLQALT